MLAENTNVTLDLLMVNIKEALDRWLKQPQDLTLKQAFKDANQALLEFSRAQNHH